MNYTKHSMHPYRFFWMVVAMVFLALPSLRAQDNNSATNSQLRFATPQDAIKALSTAAESSDRATLDRIFGPEVKDFLTGDQVQDTANLKAFSEAVSEACVPASEGDDRVILEIGTNGSSFAIPLVKQADQWFFDTDAGRDEIINRHIGRDELNAIGVCRAYVKAQAEYFDQNPDGSGVKKYAQKFKSTPGQKDGLHWGSSGGTSAWIELVDEARAEGYPSHPAGTGPHPFHGYLFRILTAQGSAAPGGKSNYVVNGNMTGGFALVAYPDQWAKSGVMTFIVNQDGKVYQRNLGDKTGSIGANMTAYNPDRRWTLVEDLGVSEP
jgi:hypothetical protein